MIKGLTAVAPIATEEAFTQLSQLFQTLGFEPGKAWNDGTGKGAAFLAPLGNLEFVTGRPPAVPLSLLKLRRSTPSTPP